jgi:membrane protease YdiL (CAAX protease family)
MTNPFRHLKSRSLLGSTLLLSILGSIPLFIIIDDKELFAGLFLVLFYFAAIGWIIFKLSEPASIYFLTGTANITRKKIKLLLLTIPLILFSIASIGLTELFLQNTYPDLGREYANYEIIETNTSLKAKIVLFINIIILAPICEELIFRGFLFHRLSEKYSTATGVILSSLIFALLHVSPVGAFMFGIIMCWIYMKTQSLWVPVGIHFLNNAIAAAFYFIADPIEILEVDIFSGYYYVAVCFGISLPVLIYFLISNHSVLQQELPYMVNKIRMKPTPQFFD